MTKSRSVVKSKLNKWYDWLINHLEKSLKNKVSDPSKIFKSTNLGFRDVRNY